MAKLTKILQKHPQNKLGLLRKKDGTSTTTPKETLDVLLSEHFPGCLPRLPEEEDGHLEDFEASLNPGEPLQSYKWITPAITRKAVLSFSAYKAAGPDDIRPVVLQHLSGNSILKLTDIFVACIQ